MFAARGLCCVEEGWRNGKGSGSKIEVGKNDVRFSQSGKARILELHAKPYPAFSCFRLGALVTWVEGVSIFLFILSGANGCDVILLDLSKRCVANWSPEEVRPAPSSPHAVDYQAHLLRARFWTR